MSNTPYANVPVTPVSRPTLRRLPLYLRFLLDLHTSGTARVSCTVIANELQYDPTQIRKDLAVTGIVGRPRTGYDVVELIRAIETFLDWNRPHEAIMVGLGSLGRAILGYDAFSAESGLQIRAAFDIDPEKVGKRIRNCPVYHVSRLAEIIDKTKAKIGILAAPASVAQDLANAMADAGIRGIWNFAPVRLRVGQDTIVENVLLKTSLAVLTNRLKEMLEYENEEVGTLE